jgi:excisionase family DNA binding protein
MPLMDIKQVSAWLNLKPSTLYLWVSQGKIPALKIHGVIRFERDALEQWMRAFQTSQEIPSSQTVSTSRPTPIQPGRRRGINNVDTLIERAKRAVYTNRGETRPIASPFRKEEGNGSLSER